MRHHLHDLRKVGTQRLKAGVGFARVFVHIDRTANFYLQRMAIELRLADAANQLHALVGFVIGHAVAKTLQSVANQVNELGRAGCAVAVTENKVSQRRRIAATQALVNVVGHGVQIQMPHRAKACHAAINRRGQRRVIGPPVMGDAVLNLSDRALALIQGSGHAILADALPDQAQTLLGFDAGRQRSWPLAINLRRVQVDLIAIRVDIGARKSRLQQGCAMLGPLVPQRVHMRVFTTAQQAHGHNVTKIGRIGRAAMR